MRLIMMIDTMSFFKNGKMIGTSKLNGRIGNNGDEVLARTTKWGMEIFRFVNETQAVNLKGFLEDSELNETLSFDIIHPGRCWYIRVNAK